MGIDVLWYRLWLPSQLGSLYLWYIWLPFRSLGQASILPEALEQLWFMAIKSPGTTM